MLLKTLTRKMANSGLSAQASDVRSVASGVRLRVRLPLAAVMLLRVQVPAKHGDKIERFVLQEAQAKNARPVSWDEFPAVVVLRRTTPEIPAPIAAYFGALKEQHGKRTLEIDWEQRSSIEELAQLTKNIDHIKDIVATQQSYAGASRMVEPVQIRDLLEDALRLNAGSLERHDVSVVREFAEVPLLPLDRHRVLQILVNLISNAKQAMDGVLAAQEMGGSLTALSDGPGQGATFTLLLPMKTAEVAK